VRDEWFKGLQTAKSLQRFTSLWRDVGAAAVWIPELSSGSIPAPPASVRDPVLLTALVTSSPAAVLQRLRASNAEVQRAAAIENGPHEPADLSEASVRRWLSQVGPAASDLLLLWALQQGKEPPWSSTVQRIRDRGDPLTRADLAISGSDLQALGAKGPQVGQVLATLLNQVLEEPALNTRERLLERARGLLQ
jgi:hypothetical protein